MARRRPLGAYDTTRSWHVLDDGWKRMAACDGLPDEDKRKFFDDQLPENATREQKVVARMNVLEAKAHCWECPVRGGCLSYAMSSDAYGVWGGTTRKERKDMLKRANLDRSA